VQIFMGLRFQLRPNCASPGIHFKLGVVLIYSFVPEHGQHIDRGIMSDDAASITA